VREAGEEADYTVPETGTFMFGDAMYIHANIPEENQYYAQVLVNECLDAATQSVLAEGGSIPVNPDAKIPEYYRQAPRIWPVTEEQVAEFALPIDMRLLAKNQDAWQGAFEEATR
jgi:spermidine/putrescine-binding protein